MQAQAPKTLWDHALTTFGQNSKGDPEFGSVTFTLDNLFFQSVDDPINRGFNVKSVFSTQHPAEALAAILTYEGLASYIAQGHYQKIVAPHYDKSMIYSVIGKNGRIHVIVATSALRSFVDAGHVGAGSSLVGFKALIDSTLQAMETARSKSRTQLAPTVTAIEVEEVIATITQERADMEAQAFEQRAKEVRPTSAKARVKAQRRA